MNKKYKNSVHLKVNRIYVNSLNHDSRQAKNIYSIAKSNHTDIIEAENGQTVYNNAGVQITNYIIKDTKGVGDNESSIVTLIKYNDFSMLFTGDAGIELPVVESRRTDGKRPYQPLTILGIPGIAMHGQR